jgi:glycosyltransferase involved in cell wall biosynthesis
VTNPLALEISAVVTTFNRPQMLQRAIDALLDSSFPIKEILVVDNSTTDDGSRHVPFDEHPGLRHLPTGHNIGLPGAIGLGFRSLRLCDAVLILDDDTIIDRAALTRMAAALGSDVGATAVPMKHTKSAEPNWTEPSVFPWSPSLVRWDAIQRIGPPLELLFFCYDDWEYALRLRRADYRIVWVESDLPQQTAREFWMGRFYLAARNLNYLVVHKGLRDQPLLSELQRFDEMARDDAWPERSGLVARGLEAGLACRMGPPPAEFLKQ